MSSEMSGEGKAVTISIGAICAAAVLITLIVQVRGCNRDQSKSGYNKAIVVTTTVSCSGNVDCPKIPAVPTATPTATTASTPVPATPEPTPKAED